MTASLAGNLTAASDRPVTRGRPAALALARAMGRLASGRVWLISAAIFAPCAAVFMAASLAMVITRLAPGRPLLVALAALPLVASAFDYLENLCAWMALAAYPEPAATNSVLGLASAAKTTTSWLAGILLLSALTALIVTTIVRRVRPAPHGVPAHDPAQVR